jgi:hypothetical protein
MTEIKSLTTLGPGAFFEPNKRRNYWHFCLSKFGKLKSYLPSLPAHWRASFPPTTVSTCPSICLPTCLPMFKILSQLFSKSLFVSYPLYIYNLCLSHYRSLLLSMCLSICLWLYQSLSVYVSINVSLYLSLFICLSLSVYVSINIPLSLSLSNYGFIMCVYLSLAQALSICIPPSISLSVFVYASMTLHFPIWWIRVLPIGYPDFGAYFIPIF